MPFPITSVAEYSPVIAVIIPCFRVKGRIDAVLKSIGPEVTHIYVVDDACPEQTGIHVKTECRDSRVQVLTHSENQGVGGAVMTGYQRAIADGADILIKLDGDGQMDASLIPVMARPIVEREADYTKGNRFYFPEDVQAMPPVRLFGNAVLSFVTKFSSGYWTMFDPTNGYTAIEARVAAKLPFAKISRRYFFESDMLFRLYLIGAVIMDIPMPAVYGEEKSNLKIHRVIGPFVCGNLKNGFKRIFYEYFLRNVSIASFELVLGLLLTTVGVVFGVTSWVASSMHEQTTPAGTVMLAALPIILGFQLLLAFLSADIAATPKIPLVRRIKARQ